MTSPLGDVGGPWVNLARGSGEVRFHIAGVQYTYDDFVGHRERTAHDYGGFSFVVHVNNSGFVDRASVSRAIAPARKRDGGGQPYYDRGSEHELISEFAFSTRSPQRAEASYRRLIAACSEKKIYVPDRRP